MGKVTLDQTHALLEKLAEYVMTEIPAIKEKLDQKADKADLLQKADKADLQQKADKIDLVLLSDKMDSLQKNAERLDNKIDMILEGMDAQTQQLDIIRIDMKAMGGTLDMHERRLGNLEERTFGYRVRDKDDKYE